MLEFILAVQGCLRKLVNARSDLPTSSLPLLSTIIGSITLQHPGRDVQVVDRDLKSLDDVIADAIYSILVGASTVSDLDACFEIAGYMIHKELWKPPSGFILKNAFVKVSSLSTSPLGAPTASVSVCDLLAELRRMDSQSTTAVSDWALTVLHRFCMGSKKSLWYSLVQLCRIRPEVASQLLPHAMSAYCRDEDLIDFLNQSFLYLNNDLSEDAKKSESFANEREKLAALLIKSVNLMRLRSKDSKEVGFEAISSLSLNYDVISFVCWRSGFCEEAVFYAEACVETRRTSKLEQSLHGEQKEPSLLRLVASNQSGGGGAVSLAENSMAHAYRKLDAVSSISGASALMDNVIFQRFLRKSEKNWETLLTLYTNTTPSSPDFEQYLKLCDDLGLYARGPGSDGGAQAMMDLGQWDLFRPVKKCENVGDVTYWKTALAHTLYVRDQDAAKLLVRNSQVALCKTIGQGCDREAFVLANLIDDVVSTSKPSEAATAIASLWTCAQTSGVDAEATVLSRTETGCLLLRSIAAAAPEESQLNLHEEILDVQLRKARLRRKAKTYQVALNTINTSLASLPGSLSSQKLSMLKLELEKEAAMVHSDCENWINSINVLNKAEASDDWVDLDDNSERANELKAMCFFLRGRCLSYANFTSSETVIEGYKAALDRASRLSDKALIAEISFTLADYADQQYENVCSFMESPEYQQRVRLFKDSEKSMKQLEPIVQSYKEDSQDKQRGHRMSMAIRGTISFGKNEEVLATERCEMFLHTAVGSYLHSLQFGDKDNAHVFRVVALWLLNLNDPELNRMVLEAVPNIPAYKWLPVFYQLAVRVTSNPGELTEFKKALDAILRAVCEAHPYHTVYVIYALTRGEYSKTGGDSAELDRVNGARALLTRLSKHAEVGKTVKHMKELAEAYDELVQKRKALLRETRFSDRLRLMASAHPVPLPTQSLEVRKDGCYGDGSLITISKFVKEFDIANGLTQPFIVTVRCSDGICRKQLVKGKDDLRQDAILEQAFRLINQQLSWAKDSGSVPPDLLDCHMATYNVVPLGPACGLIEFCNRTTSLGMYLLGDGDYGGGAHHKYYPSGPCGKEITKDLGELHKNKQYDLLLPTMLNWYRKFRPVMRHFFLETYQDAAEWLKRRQAYVKSVATSSMVGFMLGLGDRHCQNILISYDTAELIHIDLGVAFEQGKALWVPEIVPFRLTRDIIDGMGPCGVEGLFTKCCEWNLKLLRGSKRNMLPIFSVLLHDPLTSWTLAPDKMNRIQPQEGKKGRDSKKSEKSCTASAASTAHVIAQRVILRLTDKLSGKEGAGDFLSVEGHVNYLIREAKDVFNLSQMFPGWQPFV